MIRRDYLIVGAGAGGISACEGIREHDKKGTIMLVGNEVAMPYQRPLLFGTLLRKSGNHAAEKLCVHDSAWFQKNHVDLRLDTFITQFNIERHLAVREYIVGGTPTIADMSLCGYLYYPADESGYDLPKQYPAMARWLERLKRLPRWKAPYELLPGERVAPRW